MDEKPLDSESLPRHVVIIPDGNRRWAAERGLKPWEGHEAGAENTERLVREARRLGLHELSFWGSSLENLTRRPLEERTALLRIYETHFRKLIESPEVHRDRVKIRFIGRWEEQFPGPLKRLLHRSIRETAGYDRFFLNFFLAYSGDDEMRLAIRRIADELQPGEAVTDARIKSHLMTSELPPVDLLIRTGGEPHLSAGFMMWEIADAQLEFPGENYPDFDEAAFGRALSAYAMRGRRYGK